jgi:hypothetical protein
VQSVTEDLRVVDMIMEASHGNNVSIAVVLPFIVLYPVASVATWSVLLGCVTDEFVVSWSRNSTPSRLRLCSNSKAVF